MSFVNFLKAGMLLTSVHSGVTAADAVIHIKSEQQFNDELSKAQQAGKAVVVDVYADWCGPCKELKPVLAKVAAETPEVVFLAVNGDNLPSLVKKFNITGYPTLIFFNCKGEKVFQRSGGLSERDLVREINRTSSAVQKPLPAPTTKEVTPEKVPVKAEVTKPAPQPAPSKLVAEKPEKKAKPVKKDKRTSRKKRTKKSKN